MPSEIKLGALTLSIEARVLTSGASSVPIEPRAFDLLAYLVQHRTRAVSRDELVSAVWGRVDVAASTVPQCILRLRRALSVDSSLINAVRTVSRHGYQWIGPAEVQSCIDGSMDRCRRSTRYPYDATGSRWPSFRAKHMDRHCHFSGGAQGAWRIDTMQTLTGMPLAQVARLDVLAESPAGSSVEGGWVLQGFTSNTRYAEREEVDALRARQAMVGRPEMRCAALIPIRKTAAWWSLAQDERRAIFETQSRHIGIGMDYLPQIARQLHHCRDIDTRFDFLTWFEFAPEHASLFDTMLARLRATAEWEYVDREIDIRMTRIE